MGIWQHTHTVTTTEVSPDLGEFAKLLDGVSVEMIPLRYHTEVSPDLGEFAEMLGDVSVDMIQLRDR